MAEELVPTAAQRRLADLTRGRGELVQWRRERHWAPNRLRHALAIKVRSSQGLEAAQIMLGHSSGDVTLIYAERDLTRGVEVEREIG